MKLKLSFVILYNRDGSFLAEGHASLYCQNSVRHRLRFSHFSLLQNCSTEWNQTLHRWSLGRGDLNFHKLILHWEGSKKSKLISKSFEKNATFLYQEQAIEIYNIIFFCVVSLYIHGINHRQEYDLNIIQNLIFFYSNSTLYFR